MNEQMISKVVDNVMKNIASGFDGQRKPCACAQPEMTLALAKMLIEKVEQKASLTGVNAVIAVSDRAGQVVAVHCMDNAYHASYDIAVNKAFTSSGLKMSTAKLGELAQPGQPLYGVQQTNGGRIVIFGGGEPLSVEGKIIGALGVSGGTAEQDTMIAAYGRDILKEVVLCL